MRGAVSMALAYNQVKNIEYSVTESRLKISFLDMTMNCDTLTKPNLCGWLTGYKF